MTNPRHATCGLRRSFGLRFTLSASALLFSALLAAPSGAAAQNEDAVRYRVPVSADMPTLGPANAPVTIVELSDFQCPFCSRAHRTVNELVAKYGDQLRIVFRHNPLPFHQHAMPAAEFALEGLAQGGNRKFWKAVETLFEHQRDLTDADLERYADKLGYNVRKFKRSMREHRHLSRIQADQALAKRLGATGTPTFFINGRMLRGAQKTGAFETIIDEELVAVARLRKQGISARSIYEHMTANGLRKPSKRRHRAGKPRRSIDDSVRYQVPVGRSASVGAADALVTIVQFADYQCPFCVRALPTLKQLQAQYGADLRIVFKHNPLPFHKHAPFAAKAALAARDAGRFEKLHSLLLGHSRQLDEATVIELAGQAGLDKGALAAAIAKGHYDAELQQNIALARKLGAVGTPTFFINGRVLRGAQPIEVFQAEVGAEMAAAKQTVSQGTPRAQVYRKLMRTGVAEAQYKGQPTKTQYTLQLPARAPARGGRNASVVVEIFSDFQCPFCKRVEPTLAKLRKHYGDRVRWVWRDYPLPFHQQARVAAEAAREVFEQLGEAKFWTYQAMLFEHQDALTTADLRRYAVDLGGLDLGVFDAALRDHRHLRGIEETAEALKTAGARIGTPSFFINGTLLQGAQPMTGFQQVIDPLVQQAH